MFYTYSVCSAVRKSKDPGITQVISFPYRDLKKVHDLSFLTHFRSQYSQFVYGHSIIDQLYIID